MDTPLTGAEPGGDAPADTADAPDADVLPDRDSSRRRRRRSGTRQLIEWVVLIASALVIALLIKTFLFQAFYIPSESMVPTLQKNDRVLVNKLSYDLHDVHRGDIVVFTSPPGEDTGVDDLVKRVIGLPGETVEGHDGAVYIDGVRLDEPYLPEGTQSRTFGPVEVPAGSYFMMGDNRLESRDSVFFGPISGSTIVGRVFVRIWPPGRLGFL